MSKKLIAGSPSFEVPSPMGDEPCPVERLVPRADIVACAKPNCNQCLGRGVLTITPPGQANSKGLYCSCAVKRFFIKNKGQLVKDKLGNFFYKE
jgi:hypothetical protein